jgi:transcriptional regulator with XRE-family HTH domain
MAREPENLAEMRRELGAQLTVFRVAAELSQSQLARAVCCDRTNVTHIEKGRSRGDERFWTIADELCGAEGALLAAFRVVAAAKEAHEVQVREAQLAESPCTELVWADPEDALGFLGQACSDARTGQVFREYGRAEITGSLENRCCADGQLAAR